MELYEHLRELRTKAGYSQEALAEELGVSRQAVSKWESGTANPDINHLMKLGELYQVSTDYILFGDFPKTNKAESLVSEVKTQEMPKVEQVKNPSVNGIIWLALGILAILILYYATNGF